MNKRRAASARYEVAYPWAVMTGAWGRSGEGMEIKELMAQKVIAMEKTQERRRSATTGSKADRDTVALSREALDGQASVQADVMADRANYLKALKEQVRSGSYKPNIREVALNLLLSDLDPLL